MTWTPLVSIYTCLAFLRCTLTIPERLAAFGASLAPHDAAGPTEEYDLLWQALVFEHDNARPTDYVSVGHPPGAASPDLSGRVRAGGGGVGESGLLPVFRTM